ncbi:hypothetical protein [Peribacillus simplex]|uniref:hypothetical protein n=1 Tax=Peribacillus simplex TaxID=1478 RepID=UPI001625A300|nr:hypothetical protein [Peribacillus simplex]
MYNQERSFYNKNYSMNRDVHMSIRDRGILKWQAALILPEHKEVVMEVANQDWG